MVVANFGLVIIILRLHALECRLSYVLLPKPRRTTVPHYIYRCRRDLSVLLFLRICKLPPHRAVVERAAACPCHGRFSLASIVDSQSILSKVLVCILLIAQRGPCLNSCTSSDPWTFLSSCKYDHVLGLQSHARLPLILVKSTHL